jgi:hypothetical protein
VQHLWNVIALCRHLGPLTPAMQQQLIWNARVMWRKIACYLPDYVLNSTYLHYFWAHLAQHVRRHGTVGPSSQSGMELTLKGLIRRMGKTTCKWLRHCWHCAKSCSGGSGNQNWSPRLVCA